MSRLKVNQIIPFNDFGIGVGSANGKASAIFNIQSTTQGVLFPSMTTAQRNLIPAPWDGLFIYNIDSHGYEHYNGLTSSWDSVNGIQSLNGLTAKTQLLAIGSAGTAPNWVSAGSTHTLNLPLASTTAVTAGLISKADFDSFNSRLYPTKNVKYVVKNTTLGSQDFNSVKDALDSILDASISNPYLVVVGPGVFTELQLAMKPYVYIVGMGEEASEIKVSNPTMPLIVGSHASGIAQLTITGPTDVGIPVVFYTGTDLSLEPFNIVDCIFENEDIVFSIENNSSFPTLIRVINGRLPSFSIVDKVFEIDGSDVEPLFAFISGFSYQKLTAPYASSLFNITGSNARVVINNSLFESNGLTTNAISVQDGSNLTITSTVVSGMDVALSAPNVGVAPSIQTANFVTKSNNQDINIDHPGATGNIDGIATIEKVIVDPTSTVSLSMRDPENGGLFNTGPLSLGRKQSFLTNVSDLLEGEPCMGIISGGFLVDQGTFDVEVGAGFGYLQVSNFPDHRIARLEWVTTTLTLAPNDDVYVFVNPLGVITTTPSIGNTTGIILIGRVVTNSTGIELIDQSPVLARHAMNFVNRMMREALGPIYSSGSIVTEAVTPFKLNVTGGVYFFSFNRFTPVGGSEIEFTQYYQNGSGGYVSTITDTVNSTDWDDGSGTLVPISAGYFTAHTVYINCDDADEKYFVVIGQNEYPALAAIESSPLPIPPSWIKDAVTPIVRIVIEEGNPNIAAVYDIRPVVGFKSSGVNASASHSNLLDLGNDDHLQYLRVDGTRAMSGDLNMGGNSITNINLVDGIDVTAHGPRHLPGGADPIATAAPSSNLSAITTNSVGIANSLSRSDHGHAISTGAPSTQIPDQANATGVSANLARADHIHTIPTAAPNNTIGANSVNGIGIEANFSRSDHQHQVATGTPSTQPPDQANAQGSSNNLARADHIHAIVTATPVTIADANAQGAAASFSRSDHVHAHGAQTNPAQHAVATVSANGFMSAADKTKLDGIGGARIFKSGIVPGASFAGNPKTFAVVFGTAFPNTDYSITITGANTRSWSYQSKTVNGFTINANANAALAGEVSWVAINTGETVE